MSVSKVFYEKVLRLKSKEELEKIEETLFDEEFFNYYFIDNFEGIFLVLVSKEQRILDVLVQKLLKYADFVENRVTSSDEWIKNIIREPFEFIDGVWIDPDFHEINTSGIVIKLTPGLAFGTGLHDTTKLAAELLRKYLKPGDVVLDLGCGSGILSILAKKMGAGRVVAVDNDPLAVEVAKENAKKNGVDIEIRQSDLFSNVTGKFDLIISNIIAEILLKVLEQVKDFLNFNGKVIFSGIVDSKVDLFTQQKVVEHRRKNEWNALVIKF
nr:50S ribosomal protein L11 methyltransferase [Thermosipho ferrireducens]